MTVSLQLATRCGVCLERENLKDCAGCKFKKYCSQAHQTSDWSRHKNECQMAKMTLVKFREAEQALRNHPQAPFTPEDPFTAYAGWFDSMQFTQPYIVSRVNYMNALVAISTYASVTEALKHSKDLLRLGRADSTGVSNCAMFLMLRLNKVQEAYDWAEWRITIQMSSMFDRADPYYIETDTKVFNALGSVDELCDAYLSNGVMDHLSPFVAIILVKVKLLIDLRNLKRANELESKVLPEILDCIRRHIVRSDPILDDSSLLLKGNWDSEIESVYDQISKLKQKIHEMDPLFWTNFFNDESIPLEHWAPTLLHRLGADRGVQDRVKALGLCYKAWRETAGAVHLIKSI